MGNKFFGVLPKTHRWNQVVSLLREGVDAGEIAQSSFWAALTCFQRIPNDSGFNQVIQTAFEFAEAAREKNFAEALWKRGFEVPPDPTALDMIGALRSRIDWQLSDSRIHSDAAEIAQNALTKSLTAQTVNQASLFDAGPDHVQKALGRGLRGEQFSRLMHEFYSSFVHRYLTYYLSRELSNHVGPDRRFTDLAAHQEFSRALDLHIRQTVRIADEFTPGWFGKASFEGRLNRGEITRYTHVAFKKIAGEFKRGGDAQ